MLDLTFLVVYSLPMTKRHFEAIAAQIHAEQAQALYDELPMCREAVRDVAIRLSVVFNIENPRFDKAKFMAACGF